MTNSESNKAGIARGAYDMLLNREVRRGISPEFDALIGSPARLAFALAALELVLSNWDQLEARAKQIIASEETE